MVVRLTQGGKCVTNKEKGIILLLYMGVSFTVASIIMICIYCRMGIVPFGNNTMLVHDMKWQYESFLLWLGSELRGGENLFYSLNGGLGENTFGLISYYLSSPLNLLFLFVDDKYLPIAITVLLIIKVGLAASSMQIYLYSKRQDPFSIPFSLFYALSSYAVCYQFNLMWMDSFYLFPLVVLGIDKIIKGKSGFVYALSLGLCILCNYYIAFMICIFSVLYFGIFISELKKNNGILRKSFHFILFSVLGGMLFSALVIPGVLTLKDSSESRVLELKDILNFDISFNPLTSIKYFFAGAMDTNQGILGCYPLVYSGIGCFALFIMFFISPRINIHSKLRYFMLAAILFMSMCFEGINYAWHGFNMPKGCNYRFAFELVFMIVLIAYVYMGYMKSDLATVVAGLFIIAVIVVFMSISLGFRFSYLLNVLFVLILLVSYFLYNSNNGNYIYIALSLVLLSSGFELYYNGVKVHNTQFLGTYAQYDEYIKVFEDYNQFQGLMEQEDTEYRTQIIECLGDSTNEGFQFRTNSINMYSSTENKKSYKIYDMLALGTPQYGTDLEYDQFATEFTTDVLGIKYLISAKDNEDMFDNYECLLENESGMIYENDFSLPLAFPINDVVDDIENNSEYERLNILYNALGQVKTEENVYTVIGTDSDILDSLPDWRKNKLSRLYKIENGLYSDGENLIFEDVDRIRKKMKACKECVSFVDHNNTRIVAKVSYESSCYTCFSILYDDNWFAKIDGSDANVMEGYGGFLIVPTERGTHTIELHYRVPGLVIGTIISIICCIILLFLWRKECLHI